MGRFGPDFLLRSRSQLAGGQNLLEESPDLYRQDLLIPSSLPSGVSNFSVAGTFDLDSGAIGVVVFIDTSSDREPTDDLLSMRVTQTSTMDSTSDQLNSLSVLRTGES